MNGLIVRWLSGREPVHRAVTAEERGAIYTLRYRVYVGELHRQFAYADHERQQLYDDEDDQPTTTILYTGTAAVPTGTLRIRAWAPGGVPATDAARLSMERFPSIETLATAELGRLTVRPDARGRWLLPALLRAAYEHLAGGTSVELAFCYCSPGHLRYYRQFGARPYGGRLIDTGAGPIQIPLVFLLSDAAGLRRSRSFLAPFVKKYFGPGKRPVLDTTPFRRVLDAGDTAVEAERHRVWDAVRTSLEAQPPRRGVEVPPRVLKKLTESGFLLDLADGEVLLRQGVKEHEVYVILDGAFEVLRGDRRVALRTAGDLLGEIAFFTQSGQRTASVRALTKGRLLVLRRKFLEELTRDDPEAGYQVLMSMSRVMAERLSEMMSRG